MACQLCQLFGLLIIILILVAAISSRAKYYLKMITFIVTSCFLATFPIPLMLRRPLDYRNALLPASGIVKIGSLLGVNFELRGTEHVNKKNGGIVVLNHQSGIDLMVLGKIWEHLGRISVVSKKEILYLFPFGLAAFLWGTLFIDRKNPKLAQNTINKEAKAIIEKKAKLLFFPEGTRNQGSNVLLPFKKGPFHVAIESQSVIQPIVVSKYHFLDYRRKHFGSGNVIIEILPEISVKGLTKDDMDTIMTNVQNIMQEKYEKLNDEISATLPTVKY